MTPPMPLQEPAGHEDHRPPLSSFLLALNTPTAAVVTQGPSLERCGLVVPATQVGGWGCGGEWKASLCLPVAQPVHELPSLG